MQMRIHALCFHKIKNPASEEIMMKVRSVKFNQGPSNFS
jgi:hypothetical protein